MDLYTVTLHRKVRVTKVDHRGNVVEVRETIAEEVHTAMPAGAVANYRLVDPNLIVVREQHETDTRTSRSRVSLEGDRQARPGRMITKKKLPTPTSKEAVETALPAQDMTALVNQMAREERDAR